MTYGDRLTVWGASQGVDDLSERASCQKLGYNRWVACLLFIFLTLSIFRKIKADIACDSRYDSKYGFTASSRCHKSNYNLLNVSLLPLQPCILTHQPSIQPNIPSVLSNKVCVHKCNCCLSHCSTHKRFRKSVTMWVLFGGF